MEKLLNFGEFLNESVAMDSIEMPEIKTDSVELSEINPEPKGGDDFYSDSAKRTKYTQECKSLATSFKNKGLKVPEWGMVKPATFIMGDYADCSWSSAGPRQGAGIWNYATRKEVSKLQEKYNPEVYVAGYVYYNQDELNFEYKSDARKTYTELKVPKGSYNGYVAIYKREGEKSTFDAVSTFTMDQLIKFDPLWKDYFSKLAAIANKYKMLS